MHHLQFSSSFGDLIFYGAVFCCKGVVGTERHSEEIQKIIPHVCVCSSDHSPYTGCSLPQRLQSLKRKLENYNAIQFILYGILFSCWSVRMCNYVTLICTDLFAGRYSLVGRKFYLLSFLIICIVGFLFVSIFVLFVTKDGQTMSCRSFYSIYSCPFWNLTQWHRLIF
jgi:hypothetical protein